MALTPKQEKFAQVYVETGNASEAYRQAYNAKKWTENAVAVNACKTLGLANVSLRVNELKARQLEKHDVTINRVVSEYRKLAFLDIRRAFDDEGNLRPIQDLDDDTAAAIAGLEFEEVFERDGATRNHVGRIHKLKLSDKIRALDSLAKYLKMFTEGLTVQNAAGGSVQIVIQSVAPTE